MAQTDAPAKKGSHMNRKYQVLVELENPSAILEHNLDMKLTEAEYAFDNSKILFEGCTFSNQSEKLITWESGYNLQNNLANISVEVIFKSTNVDKTLPVQTIGTDKFKVIYQ